MEYYRINDPLTLDEQAIEGMLSGGARVVVQYSKPVYTPELLDEINRLSLKFDNKFEVRFYGHGSDEFDASVISRIPDVLSLSIDCLSSAKNLHALSALRRIDDLSLGIFELDDAKVLSNRSLHGLRKLSLGQTRKSNIDLGLLGDFTKLEHIGIDGHTKGIRTLVDNENLNSLQLRRIRRTVDLSFVSKLRKLERLEMTLGGRVSIDDIDNPTIQELNIGLVMGLCGLGNLGRFASLRKLIVTDQVRIDAIQFDNRFLECVKIINCKRLSRINGIDLLPSLKQLCVIMTAVDYAEFKAAKFPGTLKTLEFCSGKKAADIAIRKDFDARGFNGR